MKVVKLSLSCILLFCLAATWAEAAEVVLQNGLNSYDGCVDSWLYKSFPTNNYGDDQSIEAKNERCSS